MAVFKKRREAKGSRLLVLILFLLVSSTLWAESSEYSSLHPGDLAPAFSEPRLGGGTVDLKQYRGRVVLLNFWATWCEPCKEEMPMLVRLQNELGGRLQVLGAAVFSSDADIRKFLEQNKVTYPIFNGSYDLMGQYNQVFAVPTTYVIGTDGRVLTWLVGEAPEATIRQLVTQASK